MALCVLVYLVVGERTKSVPVSGYLVPEEGLIKVFAPQAGMVTSFSVQEGQAVKQGQLLATVSFERSTEQGPLRQQIDQHLAQREHSLAQQRSASDANFQRQIELNRGRADTLTAGLEALAQSIKSQRERLALLREMEARDAKLAQEGYLSKNNYQEAQARLLDESNRLRELERQELAQSRDLSATQSELASIPARAAMARAELERAEGEINQQRVENEDRRQTRILAPADGTVTAIERDSGKFTSGGQPLLSLVPNGARLQAHFYVTSDAIGFLRNGSATVLQYPAYPYQKFGSFVGHVVNVSRTAVPAEELPYPLALSEARGREMYYIVKVQPEKESVLAYGKQEALQAGMRVNGKIWIDRRTLLEWIFEPLYSLSGRM